MYYMNETKGIDTIHGCGISTQLVKIGHELNKSRPQYQT